MKTAKIFMNGQSQAVRLPKEFRLPGEDVFVRRLGAAVVLLPKNDPWATLKESLGMFSDECFSERGQPTEQKREDF